VSARRRMGLLPDRTTIDFEEFIESNTKSGDGVPWNYKFSFFRGKCAMIQADVARFFGHAGILFTQTWELIPAKFRYLRVRKDRRVRINRTRCLRSRNWQGKESILCGGDIYDSNQGAMSEMNCFPEAATEEFSPSHYDYRAGSFWKLNTKA
jgi:hypothetical protein